MRNFTNFGVFVELEEGVDGLIHISDLSWTKKVKHPNEFTKIGEPIEVKVLDIDKDNRRLSLGHKQLEPNPWDQFEGTFAEGTVHQGTITDIVENRAIVSLGEDVEGFCTLRNLVKADGSKAQKGETLDFKVLEFNKDSKRILVSHTRTFEEGRAEKKARPARAPRAQKEETPVIQNQAAVNTLGDIDALAALKAQMEKGE